MSQKKNKFLTGYFAVLGIGAAGLSYLAWSAWSSAAANQEQYGKTRSKLESLYKAKVFPNPANVETMKKQVSTYVEKVRELDNEVLAYQVPLPEMSVPDFQAKLQKYRDDIVAEATSAGVKLPENFDLGMGSYLSGFPTAKAVPELSAWLDGINFLVRGLIANGVYSIDSLKRPVLPFESDAPAPVEAAPKAPSRRTPPPKKGAPAPKEEIPVLDDSAVLKRYPMAVTFTASNRAVNDVLTLLANTSPEQKAPYFLVTRNIRVENEKKDGPPRNMPVEVKEESGTPGATGDAAQPFRRDAAYIFGGEKVQVYLDLDLIRFLEATATPAATAAVK